jgi:hypothetical protein
MVYFKPLSLNIIARRKNYENFSRECGAPDQDLNSGLSKYETVVSDMNRDVWTFTPRIPKEFLQEPFRL